MMQNISVAVNLRPDGSVVLEGEHSPGTSSGMEYSDTGVSAERVSLGIYRVYGPLIAVPTGWRASVFRDENDQPTVFLAITAGDGYVEYRCTEPGTTQPKDVVNLLTVRVVVGIDIPVMEGPEDVGGEEGPVEMLSEDAASEQ